LLLAFPPYPPPPSHLSTSGGPYFDHSVCQPEGVGGCAWRALPDCFRGLPPWGVVRRNATVQRRCSDFVGKGFDFYLFVVI